MKHYSSPEISLTIATINEFWLGKFLFNTMEALVVLGLVGCSGLVRNEMSSWMIGWHCAGVG